MTVRAATVSSFAKINLDLRVLNKRPDGYHELRTIFQTVSLADIIALSFTPGPANAYTLDSAIDIPDNLITRAANLVLAATQATGALHIRLEKHIPMGGGLGGGSSNAAAILLALPVLTGHPIPLPQLLELASQLGSDVPFFLLGGTAVGLGRGAELYPAPEPPSHPALLVTPGLHVSTPDAYRALNRELTDVPPSRIINSFQALAWQTGERERGGSWEAVNDFEAVVFPQHPQLEAIKGKLHRSGPNLALMSGSGSTLFAIYAEAAQRDRAAATVGSELGSERIHKVTLISRTEYRSTWWQQLREHILDQQWPPRSRYSK